MSMSTDETIAAFRVAQADWAPKAAVALAAAKEATQAERAKAETLAAQSVAVAIGTPEELEAAIEAHGLAIQNEANAQIAANSARALANAAARAKNAHLHPLQLRAQALQARKLAQVERPKLEARKREIEALGEIDPKASREQLEVYTEATQINARLTAIADLFDLSAEEIAELNKIETAIS